MVTKKKKTKTEAPLAKEPPVETVYFLRRDAEGWHLFTGEASDIRVLSSHGPHAIDLALVLLQQAVSNRAATGK